MLLGALKDGFEAEGGPCHHLATPMSRLCRDWRGLNDLFPLPGWGGAYPNFKHSRVYDVGVFGALCWNREAFIVKQQSTTTTGPEVPKTTTGPKVPNTTTAFDALCRHVAGLCRHLRFFYMSFIILNCMKYVGASKFPVSAK